MSNEIKQFEKDLALYKKSFVSVLPSHIPPEKFMRTVVGAIQNSPDILKCDKQSIIGACQRAAQDGLILDGKEAALVPFKGKATYMPMVNGILKKMRNSGKISTITAQVVHSNDSFKYNPAMDDVPNHNPDWFGDRGKMIGVYAVARMKDGGVVVEIMNMKQLDKVKGVSKTGNTGPWLDWFEEMACKTVLRRIAKFLPSSADVDQILENDNENFDLSGSATMPEVAPIKEKTKTRAATIIEGDFSPDESSPKDDLI